MLKGNSYPEAVTLTPGSKVQNKIHFIVLINTTNYHRKYHPLFIFIYQSHKWMLNNCFYSHYDKPFFEFNQFQEILKRANIGHVSQSDYKKGLTKKEWNLIRKAIGVAKLFNREFIEQETNRLRQFRNIIRSYFKDPNYLLQNYIQNQSVIKIIKEMPRFQVNQVVLAIHPDCNHFHSGSVFAYKENKILVKFFNPELGIKKVLDTNVSLQYGSKMENYCKEQIDRERQQPKSIIDQTDILTDLDYNAMSLVYQFLQLKYKLIKELLEFNSCYSKNPVINDQWSIQSYQWIGHQINILDDCLRHSMAKFRLRGLKSFNYDQIGANFSKYLAAPLSSIQKQLQTTNDPQNQNLINYIRESKTIVQQVRIAYQRRAKQIVREVIEQDRLINNQIIQEQKKSGSERKQLIQNCLGLLAYVRVSGEHWDQNPFLKKIKQEHGQKCPRLVQDISDLLYSITQKIKS